MKFISGWSLDEKYALSVITEFALEMNLEKSLNIDEVVTYRDVMTHFPHDLVLTSIFWVTV